MLAPPDGMFRVMLGPPASCAPVVLVVVTSSTTVCLLVVPPEVPSVPLVPFVPLAPAAQLVGGPSITLNIPAGGASVLATTFFDAKNSVGGNFSIVDIFVDGAFSVCDPAGTTSASYVRTTKGCTLALDAGSHTIDLRLSAARFGHASRPELRVSQLWTSAAVDRALLALPCGAPLLHLVRSESEAPRSLLTQSGSPV